MLLRSETPINIESPPQAVPVDSEITREEILAHLASVLEGLEFRASKRCQEFLQYIVGYTLDHPKQPLKERTIGIEALGRRPDYDTNADGVVRIKASEVRKRLLLHYADAGANSSIHIALPTGSYIPIFSRTIAPVAPRSTSKSPALSPPEPPGAPATQPISTTSPFSRSIATHRRAWLVLLLCAIVVAGIATWLLRVHRSTTVLSQFWQPLTSSSQPILVATDYAPVYLPPPNTDAGAAATYTLLKDQYVGGGDLIAAVKISSLLASAGHSYTLRMGTAVTFDDLRNTPTVLIGYSSTQWSEVTKNFRYFIDDNDLGMIRDNGKATDWYPHNRGNDYHVTEDYALVSRAFDPQTHSMLVLISGCTQYGTEGAARLVTDADLLTTALRGAPADWAGKNLQWILRIDLVANAPATAKVIASYYW